MEVQQINSFPAWNPSLIESLPDEITVLVLNLLPLKDQLNAEQVCSKWKKLVANGTVTARYFEGYSDDKITNYAIIYISFYETGITSNGQGYFMNEESLEDFVIKQPAYIEGKVSKEVVLKVFKKILMYNEIYSKRWKAECAVEKKIEESLKSYWERDLDMIDIAFSTLNHWISATTDALWKRKNEESVDAYLYKVPMMVLYGRHYKKKTVKEIFIPSKEKILNSEGFFFDKKKPRNKYYKDDSELKISAPLIPIKFPIAILELLDQKNEIKKEKEEEKPLFKEDFETIKTLILKKS